MKGRNRSGALLQSVAALALLAVIGLAFLLELRPVVILSGSMEPVIPTGSICLISGADRRGVPGRIVAYELQDHLVVHRISSGASDGQTFITKGDSNNTADPAPVSADQIRGNVIGAVPYLGYVVLFLSDKYFYGYWVAFNGSHRYNFINDMMMDIEEVCVNE